MNILSSALLFSENAVPYYFLRDFIDMDKIYSIQVFRGLAAVMVLIAHSNIMLNRSLFSGSLITGYVGVDFFFVLSGFIIMLTCKKNIGSGKIVGYIRKRVVRVFPAYIVYTAIAAIVSYYYMITTGTGIVTWIDVNVRNFLQSISLYPFSTDVSKPPILPVAWTLTYEMIFYVLFSSLFFIKRKAGIVLISCTWILLIVINANVNISNGDYLLYAFLSLRNIEFIMGCAMAYFASYHVNWKISATALFCGVAMLVISWNNTLNGVSITTLGNWAAFGVPFAMIIFGATRLEGLIHKNQGIIFRFMIYLGDASYSIYLVHFIVIMICRRIMFDHGMQIGYVEFWATSAIALIVSLAMYELIEKPVMRWFSRSKTQELKAV